MLEIIATTLEDAILIEKCGADRIELVSALSEGGLTPSYGLIKAVIESVSLPVNVMIRPHHQGFKYSFDEIDIMIEDIKIAKILGANGVVLGVLDDNDNVDFKKLELLLEVVGDLEVTFHRAIDSCHDILEDLKKLGSRTRITRVLSSGGPGHAEDNLEVLNKMNAILTSVDKILLVGSGVNYNNLNNIVKLTNTKELHLGTHVRKNESCFESIDENRLKNIVYLCK